MNGVRIAAADMKVERMAKKVKTKTYDEAIGWLRDHGFDLLEAPGTAGRVFVKKYNCSAAIERAGEDGVKIFAYPGCLMSGEIAKLVDHGYQKVLKTSKAEYPATADHLKALHDFTQELVEAVGGISLYNEGLGTVSESYKYDRVLNRDLPESARPERPWQEPKVARKRPA